MKSTNQSSSKFIVWIFTLVACAVLTEAQAQEVRTPPASTTAQLPTPLIVEASPVDSALSPIKPDFEIESTQVKLIDVVEPPPMPGLPPVTGTMTLKVHSVADPGLPDPPRPAPPQEREASGEFAEWIEEQRESRIAFVSATVYDRRRTLLTCYPSGGDDAVTVWSNLDFNHFSGIRTFEATGADGETRSYNLMMGIANQDTKQWRKLSARRKIEWEIPNIPHLPDGAPAFVIETKNPAPESLQLIEDLHALYRTEGRRMAKDAAAREKAYAEKKAHLLANPPKPKDVTVHFWKRETTAETPRTEGGQP